MIIYIARMQRGLIKIMGDSCNNKGVADFDGIFHQEFWFYLLLRIWA